jgi:hypothetical protein
VPVGDGHEAPAGQAGRHLTSGVGRDHGPY